MTRDVNGVHVQETDVYLRDQQNELATMVCEPIQQLEW